MSYLGRFLLQGLLVIVYLALCISIEAIPQERFAFKAESTVKRLLAEMSLEEKIGQMLQVRVYGDYSSLTSPDFVAIRDQIVRYHIGSVDLGARMQGPNLMKPTPEQVAAVINELQRASKLPLLVGSDLERGLASRLSDVPDLPFPMAFGAVADPAMVERAAAMTAGEARAVGIQWAFAPVADINSNALNPIINTRSFGDDPAQTGKLVAAYIRGAHRAGAGGMIVAVKHFPGEGDTATDPHAKATVIPADRKHLDANELVPFRAAIAGGADAVMLAQASVPAIDPDDTKLATTSSKVVDGLLRRELGFHGLVVTDALEMRGLTALYPQETNPSGRIAIDAIKAGDDVLTLPRDLNRAYIAILAAVRNGEISESRINESVRRILMAKASLGLNENRFVDLTKVKAAFSNPEPFQLAQSISDAAITLVRNDGHLLPLTQESRTLSGAQAGAAADKQKVVVVSLTDSRESRLGKLFDKEMAARNPGARFFHYYNDQIDSDANPFEMLPILKDADVVVIAAFVTHVAPRQISRGGQMTNAIGFAGPGAKFLGQVLAVKPEKTIVVSLGSPYLIGDFPTIQNYICSYSLVTTAETSAVRALFGEIQNKATLPIDLPGVAKRGFSIPWPTKSAPGAASAQAVSH